MQINDNTKLIGNNFKTILDLKNEKDLKKVILFITHIKDKNIKDYLEEWIFSTYYSKKKFVGNLTNRIKEINNKICYNQIMKQCFNSKDILSSKIENKININIDRFVNDLHKINASLCGCFFDYLVRRIISEIIKKPFEDNRSNNIVSNNIVHYFNEADEVWQYKQNNDYGTWLIREHPQITSTVCGDIDRGEYFVVIDRKNEWIKIKYYDVEGWVRTKIPNVPNAINIECRSISPDLVIENKYLQPITNNEKHFCRNGCKVEVEQSIYFGTPENINYCKLDFCQQLAYEKVKDTKSFASKDILYEIFLVSLFHTESFGFCPTQNVYESFKNIISNVDSSLIVNELSRVCADMLKNKKNILLNPSLGCKISDLNGSSIPADADICIDDCLLDIKCTKSDTKKINEIFQLLSYASLIFFHPTYKQKINTISIFNLLEGVETKYDISEFQKENFLSYLKILTNQ
jgi:hypothetical protein